MRERQYNNSGGKNYSRRNAPGTGVRSTVQASAQRGVNSNPLSRAEGFIRGWLQASVKNAPEKVAGTPIAMSTRRFSRPGGSYGSEVIVVIRRLTTNGVLAVRRPAFPEFSSSGVPLPRYQILSTEEAKALLVEWNRLCGRKGKYDSGEDNPMDDSEIVIHLFS